ncbi:hypothetical protein AKJ37_04135 [candidate division MSBL1 archaeon SCGC-AAA259I09]|uniref:pyruvate synthase n=1 Tax=candidate division MSBL1 archaeon SCGC-AAA259I09 TaxID=1698267 RepID=A0A133URP1_9EURY|nr:hypothetical protein AKJ37_04135 [candidate division MSBL1 archaeon SCGC-AAA259I09]
MWEIRFHGRGGQGIVTAAELLTKAAHFEGRHVQSIPFFAAERRGAPVKAFARISDDEIYTREPVSRPDIIVSIDRTIWKQVDLTEGVKDSSIFFLDSRKNSEEVKKNLGINNEVYTTDARSIAMRVLNRPITNTTILGALASRLNFVSLDSVKKAINERFDGEIAKKNIEAVEEASKKVE